METHYYRAASYLTVTTTSLRLQTACFMPQDSHQHITSLTLSYWFVFVFLNLFHIYSWWCCYYWHTKHRHCSPLCFYCCCNNMNFHYQSSFFSDSITGLDYSPENVINSGRYTLSKGNVSTLDFTIDFIEQPGSFVSIINTVPAPETAVPQC